MEIQVAIVVNSGSFPVISGTVCRGIYAPLQNSGNIGSDHFPLLISLNYEPDNDNTEGLEKTNAEEEAEVEEKI